MGIHAEPEEMLLKKILKIRMLGDMMNFGHL